MFQTYHLDTNLLFQFTTSQGGRQFSKIFFTNLRIFQFTTSQGGRRQQANRLTGRSSFNSRPHKEVDFLSLALIPTHYTFNSRPHKEVDAITIASDLVEVHFQFTTSQGGRRILKSDENIYESFQFTTSQGGRPYLKLFFVYSIILSIHDLTRRSTLYNNYSIVLMQSFNSRPHKEVDYNGTIIQMPTTIFQFTTSQGGRPQLEPCEL